MKRFPTLNETEYENLLTGAESYTPDGRLIMNESAEVRLLAKERKEFHLRETRLG